jgi:hypothetical protein
MTSYILSYDVIIHYEKIMPLIYYQEKHKVKMMSYIVHYDVTK